MGAAAAARMRKRVDQRVSELCKSHPSLAGHVLRFKVWSIEASMFPFVAGSSRSDPERVNRFFRGFWPRVVAEVRADFPSDTDVQSQLDGAVEILVRLFRSGHLSLSPDDATKEVGKQIAEFLEISAGARLYSVWAPLAIEYGHTMVAAAKLLNQLPE